MPAPLLLTDPFTLDGETILPIGSGLILRRSDGMLGFTNLWRQPISSDQVTWYTVQQVADRAQVPRSTIVARIKARWGRADLIKPAGWERVVDAKRNGITHNGAHRTIEGWAEHLHMTKAGIIARLGTPIPMSQVLRPSTTSVERVEFPSSPTGVEGPTLTASGGIRGTFWWRGALDNLEGHCRAHNLNPATVRNRLSRGVPFAKAMNRSDAGKLNPKRSSKRWDFATHPPYLPGDTGVDVGLSPTQIHEAEQAAKAHAAANPAPRPVCVSAADAPHTADVIDPFEGL